MSKSNPDDPGRNAGNEEQLAAEHALTAGELQADLVAGCILLKRHAERADLRDELGELIRQAGRAQSFLEKLSRRLEALTPASPKPEFDLTREESEQIASARAVRDVVLDTLDNTQRRRPANGG